MYGPCACCGYSETGSCSVSASATRRYASRCLGTSLKKMKFTPPEFYLIRVRASRLTVTPRAALAEHRTRHSSRDSVVSRLRAKAVRYSVQEKEGGTVTERIIISPPLARRVPKHTICVTRRVMPARPTEESHNTAHTTEEHRARVQRPRLDRRERPEPEADRTSVRARCSIVGGPGGFGSSSSAPWVLPTLIGYEHCASQRFPQPRIKRHAVAAPPPEVAQAPLQANASGEMR